MRTTPLLVAISACLPLVSTTAGAQTSITIPVSLNIGVPQGEFAENALRVLQNRYLKKDDQGQICETPVQLFHRVADHVSGVEKDKAGWSQRYFEMMWDRRFMPKPFRLAARSRWCGGLSARLILHPRRHRA